MKKTIVIFIFRIKKFVEREIDRNIYKHEITRMVQQNVFNLSSQSPILLIQESNREEVWWKVWRERMGITIQTSTCHHRSGNVLWLASHKPTPPPLRNRPPTPPLLWPAMSVFGVCVELCVLWCVTPKVL